MDSWSRTCYPNLRSCKGQIIFFHLPNPSHHWASLLIRSLAATEPQPQSTVFRQHPRCQLACCHIHRIGSHCLHLRTRRQLFLRGSMEKECLICYLGLKSHIYVHRGTGKPFVGGQHRGRYEWPVCHGAIAMAPRVAAPLIFPIPYRTHPLACTRRTVFRGVAVVRTVLVS
jgi:hypothetical protein